MLEDSEEVNFLLNGGALIDVEKEKVSFKATDTENIVLYVKDVENSRKEDVKNFRREKGVDYQVIND